MALSGAGGNDMECQQTIRHFYLPRLVTISQLADDEVDDGGYGGE